MAYSFAGFFGPKASIELLTYQVPGAAVVALGQQLFLVPLVAPLLARMNESNALPVDGFSQLTASMEEALRVASEAGPIAYAEAEGPSGSGHRAGILWEGGERIRTIRFGATALDTLLRDLGIQKGEGLTESETLGFHRRRFTDDWLGNE
ncbi:MAG: hypothetical protein EOO08_01750 [Chitinophagaceae bacterium]|nr:MAG: hypothetical protein EOO08_01750 [Chitinophagaceae bacterium]